MNLYQVKVKIGQAVHTVELEAKSKFDALQIAQMEYGSENIFSTPTKVK